MGTREIKMERKQPKIYYVAPNEIDSSWGTLDDCDTEYEGSTLKTLHGARDFIRGEIAGGMESDIEILLRGGAYYLDTPLEFSTEDSGRNGFKVVYKSYPGEIAVINGGKPITGWTRHEGDIYKVNIEDGIDFHTLYENGEFAAKARVPEVRYLRTIGMDKDFPRTGIRFMQGDIPCLKDIRGLQAYVWPGGPEGDWNWYSQTINVKQVNEDTGTMILDSDTVFEIGEGSRYFIQGARELISAPGEFHFDNQERILYYRPRHLPIEAQEIVIPGMQQIIKFAGEAPDRPVHDIELCGVVVRNCDIFEEVIEVSSEREGLDGSAIYICNARNITIRNCKIHNAGYHGVLLKGFAQYNWITGNLIYDIGHTGVLLEGEMRSVKDVNKKNHIENNYIHNTGKLVGHGAGIQMIQSGENKISHNRICHTPRYSISLKSFPTCVLLGEHIDGKVVSEENIEEFCHCNKNIIAYNDVSDGNYDSQDTGLFESWGTNADNVVEYNHFHDSNINFSFGFGIYIDDGGLRFTIRGNVINALQKHGEGRLLYAIYDKGYQDKLINNIVADNRVFRAAVGTFQMGNINKDIVSEKNIFFNSGDIYYFQNWDDERFLRSDYNIFCNSENRYGILDEIRTPGAGSKEMGGIAGIQWRNLSLEEWSRVAGKDFDRHSRIADPLFMNAANGDYRVRFDSPAFDLGFEALDFAAIGLTADFVYGCENESMDRIFIQTPNASSISTIKLKKEEEVQLEVVARSQSGFRMDIKKEDVHYFNDNHCIVEVDAKGYVSAKSPGICKITVLVEKNGLKKYSDILVQVGKKD